MSADRFRFVIHPERLAIARLAADEAVPPWAGGAFVTISRTAVELSITCAEERVPHDVVCERGKVCLGVEGTIPMTTVGVLASLCGALAEAKVPVFVISTYDTDYLLVSANRLGDARSALEQLGHTVVDATGGG